MRLLKFLYLIPSLLKAIYDLISDTWNDSCVHDWKEVKSFFPSEFLGEMILQSWTPFRICRKCGLVIMDAAMVDGTPGVWIKLTPVEKQILLQKIVDKGDYYELNEDLEFDVSNVKREIHNETDKK